MIKVLINFGGDGCKVGLWEQAYENMKQFIKDCEIPMHLVKSNFVPNGGRYLFKIAADNFDYEVEVEMPGLPIENVRYMDGDKQDIYQFPRLYIDGSSWVWKYAIITKKEVIEYINMKLEEKNADINTLISAKENFSKAERDTYDK